MKTDLDGIVARAAPPPERADAGTFEPVATDPASLARRRERLIEAFGSEHAAAAHARALGLSPEAWLSRFGDVRLVGPDPDWAAMFRSIFERLTEDSAPFREVRRWMKAELTAMWPAGLPCAPDAMEGPLDQFAGRLGFILQPIYNAEQRLPHPPTWADRFSRGPALAYIVGRLAADWHADILRIARLAASDRALLTDEIFEGIDPGMLVAMEPGLGDPHAGGRSVAILRFERGAVAFKPKDLRIANAVGELARSCGGLAPPALLLRDGYAWEPVYEQRPIADDGEAAAFFGALGGWLALLQPLGATDFWFDNLIAEGATPRFIDFETAAQPAFDWTAGARNPPGEIETAAAAMPGGVGILPMLMPIRDGEDPVDIGCTTRPGEHRTPLTDFRGSGLMVMQESRFAPAYADGSAADPAAHFDAFEAGYLRVARVLADPRFQDRVLKTLRGISDAPVRIILVDTWTCYRIVSQSLAPSFLSNGAWREIALHRALGKRIEASGALREGVVRDLRRADIPLFYTSPGSTDVFEVEGERKERFFEQDTISETRRRLKHLAGLPEQQRVALLRSTFALRPDNPPRRQTEQALLPPAGADDLLAWADEIASEVADAAVSNSGGWPTWIGTSVDVFNGLRMIGPLRCDILSGRTGLAQALIGLAGTLKRPALRALAFEVLTGTARDYIQHFEMLAGSGAGHVVGAGGLVAVLAAEPELRAEAESLYDRARSGEIWMHSGDDFVSGLAGWREAARALGEPAPPRHGPGRPYAPSVLPRLARWLEPESAVPLCADTRAASRLRRDRDRHGSWFADRWTDDRHDLSGIDGLPALALRFASLAGETGHRVETPEQNGPRSG